MQLTGLDLKQVMFQPELGSCSKYRTRPVDIDPTSRDLFDSPGL